MTGCWKTTPSRGMRSVNCWGGAVTLSNFRAVCRCYPERKALGPDGWRAWELSVLPDNILRAVVSLINKRVVSGWWDHSLEAVWMSVIPKPSGGHRCVGKTLMVYRIWADGMTSRHGKLQTWHSGIPRPPNGLRSRPPSTEPSTWKLLGQKAWRQEAFCGTSKNYLTESTPNFSLKER